MQTSSESITLQPFHGGGDKSHLDRSSLKLSQLGLRCQTSKKGCQSTGQSRFRHLMFTFT